MTITLREFAFLRAMLAQWGMPYLWDGKGLPGELYVGRDCSGFVTWALVTAGGPDVRATHNAARMWQDWQPTDVIRPGTVALYGVDGNHVSHVMAALWDGVVIGSAGGNHTTTTPEEAHRVGAGVQVWRSHLDMKTVPFLGWRRAPWIDAGP